MMVIMVLLSFTNYKQENVYYSVSNKAVFVSGLLLVMLAFTVSIILKMFEVKHILVLGGLISNIILCFACKVCLAGTWNGLKSLFFKSRGCIR